MWQAKNILASIFPPNISHHYMYPPPKISTGLYNTWLEAYYLFGLQWKVVNYVTLITRQIWSSLQDSIYVLYI